MYNKISEKYDQLYSKKEYKKEIDFISSKCTGKEILDIGCGTGVHSIELSKIGFNVVGTDPSKGMIIEAKKKNSNVEFINGKYITFNKKFDCIISMFNVINHISNLNELIEFFKYCSDNLKQKGIIIFDCWNSIACTIEKPYEFSTKKINGEVIKYETKTDLMNSVSYMKIKTDTSEYSLNSYLWSPKIITDILTDNNINISNILNLQYNSATEKDHRILFIGKKI